MKMLFAAACSVIILSGGLAFGQQAETGQDQDFSRLILEAKTDSEAASILEEAKESFFQTNNYQVFIDLLAKAAKKKKSIAPWAEYYTGLARYRHMKYLEETQNWDVYFSKGNDYRQEISDNLEKSLKAFPQADPLHLYSRLILWQFHKDQQDVFTQEALERLIAATNLYAQSAKDIRPIKAVADSLLAYEERSKAKEVYRLYGEKIISSELSDDELQNTAMSFYKQGNMELSQALYSVYIGRLAKSASPEKAKLELIDIANLFSYKKDAAYDLDYAEDIFVKLESMFPGYVLDESLAYQRAFNLEKNKEFMLAKDKYSAFAAAFAQSPRYEAAMYKSGVISLYIAKDIKAAQEIFLKLSLQEAVSGQVISSLYQLGLISQWQEDSVQAKDFYTKLIDKAKDGFKETVALAKARMLELEGSRPLEFNIKSLLDVTLKPENSQFSMNRVDIKASSYIAAPGETLTISSSATPPESGCMQVQLQYFWSGDTGAGALSYQESSFSTSYTDPGTKVIGLVVTTPAGVVDRGIDFIDVT
jgi:TolA-binding protein